MNPSACLSAWYYQCVVVVHLDENAWRLLLNVLQIATQQQTVHQQTLVPCWTESLTDHLTATHTQKQIRPGEPSSAQDQSTWITMFCVHTAWDGEYHITFWMSVINRSFVSLLWQGLPVWFCPELHRLHLACFWPNPVKTRQTIKISEHERIYLKSLLSRTRSYEAFRKWEWAAVCFVSKPTCTWSPCSPDSLVCDYANS